ncbi:uncharacterized protein FIESC28_10253 [Fusarium coffeatum]|uniref:Uncharacterized protein n=1 Tax=Fusarium coffeatum TaxID=231269 RepID=A0A366QU96_9HYPO|nr:uncharacterized protein FIESC28_10253 [Fusarium coffeatum]RBR08453.1 hypothetical protein FIESC28_10253 [Fusarium coffeatum]
MVSPSESPHIKIEEDDTYQALENPAQKSVAKRVYRLTCEWPWDISPSCSQTKWDTSLLEKLVNLLIECFPERVGQLGLIEMRQLRTEIKSQLETKPHNEQKALSMADLEAVRRGLLNKRTLQTPNGSSKTTTTTIPTNLDTINKRRVSAASFSEPSTTKRVRVNESPPAFATRSSTRLRQQTQNIDIDVISERPVDGHTSAGFALADQVESDEEEVQDQIDIIEETEDSGETNHESDEAEEEDSPTSYEEPLPDTAPPSPNRNSTPGTSTGPRPASTTGKPLVAELSMSDKQIVDLLRKHITSIASKKQDTNNQKLKDLQDEVNRCALAHDKAEQETTTMYATMNAMKKSYEDALKEVQKSENIRNKTADALKPYQDLVDEGEGDAQLFEMLKNKLNQAEMNLIEAQRNRDQMKRDLEVVEKGAKAKLAAFDLCKAQLNEAQQLQKAREPNNSAFRCTLTFKTDARDEEDQLFKDIFFDFTATVKEQEDGVNGGS